MALRRIPLNFQTLYADLAQGAGASSLEHASIVRRRRRGRHYLYAVSKDGAERRERYLGPADDADAIQEANQLRHAALQARAQRSTVSALKQARIPAPSLKLGRVLEVLANEGLFQQGVVLVGTAAYQTYSCQLGFYLSISAIMTNDADLLVASFVAGDEQRDLERILQRADPTFRAQFATSDRLPKVFKSSDNFAVDILTKYGRGKSSPVLVEALGCSAEALSFMEYLSAASVDVVALYGAGVLVRVPEPMRFAIHKLLIAPERNARLSIKAAKDLTQASELLDIFIETEPDLLMNELEAARGRGAAWRANINASLDELGRVARKGNLPLRA